MIRSHTRKTVLHVLTKLKTAMNDWAQGVTHTSEIRSPFDFRCPSCPPASNSFDKSKTCKPFSVMWIIVTIIIIIIVTIIIIIIIIVIIVIIVIIIIIIVIIIVVKEIIKEIKGTPGGRRKAHTRVYPKAASWRRAHSPQVRTALLQFTVLLCTVVP